MEQPIILKEYSWVWDLIRCIANGQQIPVKYIHFMGSRFSGKTMIVFIFIMLCLELFDENTVAFAMFRSSMNNRTLLEQDFCSALNMHNVNYTTNTKQEFVKVGNHKVRIYGLNSTSKNNNSAKKAGLPRFSNTKYVFVFFEEAFEFSTEDIEFVKQAIRGTNKETQYIYITACNPWAKTHPHIKFLESYQPFDIKTMKTVGNQLGVYEYELKDETTGLMFKEKMLIQYTNWRVTKDLLSKDTITTILGTWQINPTRAVVVDYGAPGYEDGAIYTHLIQNIGKAMYERQEYVLGGVDYGWGRNQDSGKTVALFGGCSIESGIDVYNEYVHSNHKVVKSPDKVAEEIVQFFISSMGEYVQRCNLNIPVELNVKVDNAEQAFIQMLNNTAQRYRVNQWLYFRKCKKYPIEDRIEATLGIMGKQKLRFSNKISLLKSEMETSFYEEGVVKKRVKKDDHALNAFEYMIEPIMYKMSRSINLTGVMKKIW